MGIAVVAAFFYAFVWPTIKTSIGRTTCENGGGTYTETENGGYTCTPGTNK